MIATLNNWRHRHKGRRWSTLTLGLVALAVLAAVAAGVALKPKLEALLGPGNTITAEFKENYRGRIFPYTTTVKLAGVEIGTVSDVEPTDHGTTLVHMKVDVDMDKLGPAPSASLEPHTLLGGRFSVDLYRGGGDGDFNPGDVIPPERTRLPVELDSVLDALPGQVRTDLQGTVKNLDSTLADGGSDAVRKLVTDAPGTLAPAGRVADAVRGTRPGQDLPQMVTNLESTARVIGDRSQALSSIVDDLHTTTSVLSAQSGALQGTINQLPPTLDHTRTGLADLDGSLKRLTATAGGFRPTAEELPTLLDKLDPVLRDARPLLAQLEPLLDNAQPAFRELVPTAQQANGVLQDVRGPVIDRVNGPIMSMLLNTWHGTGPYQGSGDGFQADHKFYQELGYMVTNLDRSAEVHDANGATLSFLVSVAPSTPYIGTLEFEELLHQLQLQSAPTGPNTKPLTLGGAPGLPSLPGQPGNPSPAVPAAPALPNLVGGNR